MFFSKTPELRSIDLIDQGRIQLIKKNEWECGKFLLMQLNENEISDVAKRERAKKISENKHLHSVRVIRKFIVVEPGEKSSKCLAVNTYSNQATTHPNVKHLQWQHGIIWSDKKPDPLPGEHNLCSHALRINVVPKTKHISKFARINYGEVFEVSHDREVYILGTLDPNSVPMLKHYYKKIRGQIDSKAPTGNPVQAQPATVPQPAAAPKPANILIPTQAIELTNPAPRANPALGIARIPHRDEPLGLISPPKRSTRAANRHVYFYPSRESSRKFPAYVLFDTGASSNLMSERYARMIQARIGPCRQFTMYGIGKTSITSYTKCRWQVGNQQNDEIYEDDFYISTSDMYPLDAIVGVQALLKYKLIKWYS